MQAAGVLSDRYRPIALDEMVGQEPQREALAIALATGGAHAFLLSGPQGVGKTTMARIAAEMIGAELIEVPAAVYTGIDAMRELVDTMDYRSFTHDYRAAILDEAHRLSKQAWDASLKAIEEPPPHAYWFLCTTASDKVPATIRDRCLHLKLKPLPRRELERLLQEVSEAEGFAIEPETLAVCVEEANGSARAALHNLGAAHQLDWRSARDLLREGSASPDAISLCRMLVSGGDWLQAVKLVTNISEDAETVRIIVSNYVAAVLKNAKDTGQIVRLLGILEAFAMPYNSSDKVAPLLISVGRVMFPPGG